jgi:TonB family protein
MIPERNYNQGMRSIRILAVAILFLVCAPHLQAQNVKWIEVTSENFRLFTDTTEVKGRRLVSDFEQRVTAFQAAFGSVPKRQFPIEIFLFKQDDDFHSFAPTDAAQDQPVSAYLLKGPDRNFIVTRDKSPEDISNDVGHALGHLFFDRIVLWHPFWLEEGAAEYFRKVGRNPDGKRVAQEDRLRAGDVLKIVQSSTYNDADPAGGFRIQSYRLLRIVLEQNAAELRSFLMELKLESSRDAKLAIDEAVATDRLFSYVETRIPPASTAPVLQVREVAPALVAVHRGDALVAARQTAQAVRWYEGDSEEARAGRAILARISGGKDAGALMERSVLELQGHGLLQFYFGTIDTRDERLLGLQTEALERAVRLLPLMGRAEAELARVLTLGGKPSAALPLLDLAMTLEPEFGDRFYLIRVEALLALRKYDESRKAAMMAAALPHADRAAASIYDQKVALVDKVIRDLAETAERQQVEELRSSIEAEALRREPPKPPPPPSPPDRAGQINYQYEATNPVEIVNSVIPDYPDELVKKGKTGKVSLQVKVGVDGKVVSATVTDSQLPEMNAETVTAAGKWTFKPYSSSGRPTAYTIKLVFAFSLQ